MINEPLRIIGINPGTRYMGITIFMGSELREWRIKIFSGKWSKDKMEKIKKIILDFIELYNPNILAIKKLHSSRSSQSLKNLIVRLKDICRRKGLKLYQYSIDDLEKFFVLEGKANKKNLVKIIASEYTDIFHELKREKENKNPYYIRMFEAIALAAMCFHQLDNH